MSHRQRISSTVILMVSCLVVGQVIDNGSGMCKAGCAYLLFTISLLSNNRADVPFGLAVAGECFQTKRWLDLTQSRVGDEQATMRPVPSSRACPISRCGATLTADR
jgi:hypothetical protein